MEENNESLKIAVVDDATFSRRNIISILEDNGFNVVGEAGSAEEAMKVHVNSSPNLFLIDVIMPNRSGLELAKVLSENNYQGEFIMMSSLDSQTILIESISHGAIDFLVKPFETDQLLKAIKKAEERIVTGNK